MLHGVKGACGLSWTGYRSQSVTAMEKPSKPTITNSRKTKSKPRENAVLMCRRGSSALLKILLATDLGKSGHNSVEKMERRRGCVYGRDGLAFHSRSEARSIPCVLSARAEGTPEGRCCWGVRTGGSRRARAVCSILHFVVMFDFFNPYATLIKKNKNAFYFICFISIFY